jgi:hypothetical protein
LLSFSEKLRRSGTRSFDWIMLLSLTPASHKRNK